MDFAVAVLDSRHHRVELLLEAGIILAERAGQLAIHVTEIELVPETVLDQIGEGQSCLPIFVPDGLGRSPLPRQAADISGREVDTVRHQITAEQPRLQLAKRRQAIVVVARARLPVPDEV